MMNRYELTLGLPHTNHLGLAEHLLLQWAGHYHWTSLARAIGTPLSSLRTASGHEVYATFYFVEERFPDQAAPDTFHLDDRLQFAVFLRAYKGISVETKMVFDREDRLSDWIATEPTSLSEEAARAHPFVRMATIFITPETGNSRLKVASPAGIDFSRIAALPNDDNPYQLTRLAREMGTLGLTGDSWMPVTPVDGHESVYAIDIDRDTNGAGLFYFANYVTVMDRAERAAMIAGELFSSDAITGRSLEHRRIAYFGNVSTSDSIRTRVFTFRRNDDASRVALRYEMRRDEDGELICLSEAVKKLGS